MTMKRIPRLKNLSAKVVSENSQNNPTPRHEYLVEKERIKNEIGNLEEIRLKLGLSQRRACQLLLVDPSAWTRWNKTEAPPHIYQALKWLLELRKVNPEAAGPRNFESRLDFMQTNTQSKIERLEAHIEMLEKAVALSTTASTPQYTSAPVGEDFSPSIEAIEQKLSELESKIEAAQKSLGAKPKASRAAQTRSKNKKAKASRSIGTLKTKTPTRRAKAVAKTKSKTKQPRRLTPKSESRSGTAWKLKPKLKAKLKTKTNALTRRPKAQPKSKPKRARR